MDYKCDYCGQFLDDQMEKCPNCGAPNTYLHRTSDAEPKTIEELKKYCDDNGYTPERTRFFVGIDYGRPKAFGIYKSADGEFVVYKNKADGTRAIRYKGKDEAYAVHELYQRLQDEILNQKLQYIKRNSANGNHRTRKRQKWDTKSKVTLIIFAVILVNMIVSVSTNMYNHRFNHGYYQYNDRTYYYADTWYAYDSGNWQKETPPRDMTSSYKDYYQSKEYDSSYGTSDFKNTDFYSDWQAKENSNKSSRGSSRSSSSYDSGWSSSDWDSSSTDWDSDW